MYPTCTTSGSQHRRVSLGRRVASTASASATASSSQRLVSHTAKDLSVSLDDAFDESGDPLSIEQWQSAFEASEFATMTPVAIEAELHLPIADHLVICKIDAVFATSDGVHIVDWKTGQQPHNDEELAHKALQLAAYRLAWSHWSGVGLEDIQASFWFVATQTLVTPENLPGWERLDAQLRQALGD